MADLDPVVEVGVEESCEVVESDDEIEVEDEESRAHKRAVRPHTPTKAELEEHLPLHINYRDWREDCVRARALAAQHRTSTDEALDGVTWNMD